MKRIGLISTSIILFAVSLYAAYLQGASYVGVSSLSEAYLAAPANITLSPFWVAYMHSFSWLLNGLTGIFGGSLVAAVVVLALIAELCTLYPVVSIQLLQKKIHLFHKKLVDRFQRGELSMSKTKHELNILYSVNEEMHTSGACFLIAQMFLFLLVLVGLFLTARVPGAMPGAYSNFNFALLSRPIDASLPVLASLAYLLYALIRIYLKQREDFINPKQVNIAFGFALLFAGLVYFLASSLPVLMSVYFLTLITFGSMRYIVVEEKAKEWGKAAQRELIQTLRTSTLHKNKLELWSRKFNHLPIVRLLNSHLLEEAASMSLLLFIALSGLILM